METYDTRLQAPFTMQITGGTGSGKTHLTRKIIEAASEMIHPPPERIIYAYGEWQSIFSEMNGVEFVKGINEKLVSRENLDNKRTLLVIDDLSDSIDEKLIGALFTRMSHHRHISVIFLLNNLFYRGLKNMRDIALNTHYYIITRSVRDYSSITTLAKQMFGKDYKSMMQAYADATKDNFGYLMVDLKPNTKAPLRLRTHIFPNENTVLYVIKNG